MPEYIEREALLETLKNYRDAHADVDDADGCELIEDVMREINAQATADVAPVVHGEWLLRHEGYGHYWECSSCHKNPCIYVTKDTRYCPNCGAKMEGDTENATD